MYKHCNHCRLCVSLIASKKERKKGLLLKMLIHAEDVALKCLTESTERDPKMHRHKDMRV